MDAPAPKLSPLRRPLVWLAPALLCGVAIFQIVLTGQTALSPWKLGGFGMYSSVDSVRSRWIRVLVVTPSGELPVVFERLVEDLPALQHAARNVRSLPDPRALAGLGQVLLAGGEWADCTPARLGGAQGRVSGHYVRLLSAAERRAQGCRRLPVEALRLEIWRYRYESADRRVRGEKLAETLVERRAG